jgi:hypothetical protein
MKLTKTFIYKMTNREHWMSIDGYDNYEVSDYGRVRNITTERILKPGKSGKAGQDYYAVSLYKNCKCKTIKIHKLVGLAFLPQRKNDIMIIDHIDRNRFNNMASNLRWVTCSQNSQNATKRKGTSSEYKGVSWNKLNGKWMCHIRINGIKKYLGSFTNEIEAAKQYNEAALKYQDFPLLNVIDE